MEKSIAEYIWIDAYNMLRSKSRTICDGIYCLTDLPDWNFDGSSTGQATGNNSEVIIKPKFMCNSPFNINTVLVLCDCYDIDGQALSSNHRSPAQNIFDKVKDQKTWFGLEQEYVLYDVHTKRPLGWPSLSLETNDSNDSKEPVSQGKYYCGVGADRVFGRKIITEHYHKCLDVGIKLSGVNAEVMPGQWEFQVGPCEGIQAGDHMWIARYILEKICEEHGVYVSYDPKPEKGDWNGSGCHVNYSTENMRQAGGMPLIMDSIKKLQTNHAKHIQVYGDNTHRLTGKHETSSIDEFTYGVGNRTASIRIPSQTYKQGYGYLEDRRPASDIDPYTVTAIIAETTLL